MKAKTKRERFKKIVEKPIFKPGELGPKSKKVTWKIKRLYKKLKSEVGLKTFARQLMNCDDVDHKMLAETWLLNKGIV